MTIRPGDRLALDARLRDWYGSVGVAVLDSHDTVALLTAAHVVRDHVDAVWYAGRRKYSQPAFGRRLTCSARSQKSPTDLGIDAALILRDAASETRVGNVPRVPAKARRVRHPPGTIGDDVREPTTKEWVWKVGLNTKYTIGRVAFWDHDPVPQRGDWWSPAHFVVEPCAGYQKFADEGDSGAVVFDFDGRPVGLLVGGTPNAVHCMPLTSVVHELRIQRLI